jgi:alpha-galactosidase
MISSHRSLASTPPMVWNSWSTFGNKINETVIRETADALVSSGLKDHGYEYIVIDDC